MILKSCCARHPPNGGYANIVAVANSCYVARRRAPLNDCATRFCQNERMDDEHSFTLLQIDQARGDGTGSPTTSNS
jgi:hypothetical protein